MQEKARRNLLIETMQKGGYAYVDVEDDVKKSDVEEAAHSLGMKVIRSIHDFQGVPADIFSRVHSLASRGDVAKIAVTPHNIADIMTLFRINDELKKVTVDGEPVKLTPIEYNILLLLMKNQGKVFSIDQIYENIWNEEAIGVDNTVAVHIRHIREKIEINPKEPRYLKVVWGVGYKIEKL